MFSAFINGRQKQWVEAVSWQKSWRTISVEAGRAPGFLRSHQLLGHPSFLKQSLGRGWAQQQPWGKGLRSVKPGAGLQENEAKSNVFIWVSGCLITLYLQMCWGLLTALQVQLDCETWLETWHFSSEGPCVEIRSRRRPAPVLMMVGALMNRDEVSLIHFRTLNKSMRLMKS